MLPLIRWLIPDQWWPLSQEARLTLEQFGLTSPADLEDAPVAFVYALRARCPEQLETLREIAANYHLEVYL
ncbi:MAG: hypothetical protein AAFX65_07465 [Cyanobacteria bacterium J06638_7]